jgi:hypothetical protein
MAEVLIDDDDPLPAELPGARGERVLASLAFQIVLDLGHRRLPHVDIGRLRQVAGGDLAHDAGSSAAATEGVLASAALIPLRRACKSGPTIAATSAVGTGDGVVGVVAHSNRVS